jgi:hypothetical protein
MYAVFGYYFIEILNHGEGDVLLAISNGAKEPGWFKGGALYAMYNLAIAPVLLFSTRAIQTRREAILAGIFAGVAVMIPAVLFHVSYAVGYPEVLNQAVPNYWMMARYTTPLLLGIFLVALLGTLVETGAGLVQGLIERIETVVAPDEGDALGHPARAAIAVITLILGGLLGVLRYCCTGRSGIFSTLGGFCPRLRRAYLHSGRFSKSSNLRNGDPDGHKALSASLGTEKLFFPGSQIMIVYLNGDYIPAEEARISPFDRGFLFGDGVYDATPSYGGRPVALQLHLDRMNRGLKSIGIEIH